MNIFVKFKTYFKISLFILAVLLIFFMFLYTNKIVDNLRKDSKNILELNARFIAKMASSSSEQELSFIFDEIIKKLEFPIVITDTDGEPTAWKKEIGILPDRRDEETIEEVKSIVRKMDKYNEPIPIEYEGNTLWFIHYSDSQFIKRLEWLPYIQILAIGLFVFIGFMGIHTIRKNEERLVWVGMAKETAHQLGTPLSSMMGWVELIREKAGDSEVNKIINEMDNDLSRLNKIIQRFSQIGSKSELKPEKIESVLKDVTSYFQRRLPQTGKNISVVEDFKEVGKINLNKELFEWAVENIVKNAIDAINKEKGVIKISLFQENSNVVIEISDDGKGIPKSKRKEIFRPGYSTKRRGWGLGLSLVKRIVVEYHEGEISLKESRVNGGSVFRIVLKR